MKEIKFSHQYDKLLGMSSTPKLIQVLKIRYNDLSKEMIEYDTKIYESDYPWKEDYYKLPKTDLILLIFQSDRNMIFTTIRRFTEKKFEYYKKAVGEYFVR